MASFNRVILMGNLTRDPEVKTLLNGSSVGQIGLAVNRTWFDKASNQRKEEVTFIDVTLWGREAEIAGEYLAKGRPVMIEGRLTLEQWEDKKTGDKRSKLKVTGERLILMGKGDSTASPESQLADAAAGAFGGESKLLTGDEDVPF